MSRKPAVKISLKVVAPLSILMYTLCRVLTILILDSFTNYLWSGRIPSELQVNNRLSVYSYFLAIDAIPLIITGIVAVPVIKRVIAERSQDNSVSDAQLVYHQQREIEKQNKLINNLTNLYNDAVEYNKVKTEFFANISHELKTPLSVILGAIQLIDQKSDCPSPDRLSSSKHLRTIRQNSYRLVRLINNILDITKIESGYVKMNITNCNIVYLIEEITQSILPFAEQKNISLVFDTDFEEIVTAIDIDKIERIMLNLLSNAIKFTPSKGKISVDIKAVSQYVSISIKDTGPGIPPCMQSIIFERFRQVSNSFTRNSEGTGIGLSLVKSFVELHGGNIMVNSEEGKGSEFIIHLPIKLMESGNDTAFNAPLSQPKIIEAINIEFSDIYSIAS